MSSSKWRKVLSLVLVLVLIFQMMPVSAMADNEETAEASTDLLGLESLYEAETDYTALAVTEELVALREESVKHFRLENGLQVAVAYPEAVHYEEDGQWVEIDNSLRSGTLSYTVPAQPGVVTEEAVASAGVLTVSNISAEAENAQLPEAEAGEEAEEQLPAEPEAPAPESAGDEVIIISGGEESAAEENIVDDSGVIIIGGEEETLPDGAEDESAGEIIILDGEETAGAEEASAPQEDGVIIIGGQEENEDAATDLEIIEEPVLSARPVTQAVYTNTANDFVVNLPQSFDADSRVSISNKGYTLYFGLEGTGSSGISASVMDLAPMETTLNGAGELVNDSGLTYTNVFPGLDIAYQVNSRSLKENIILKTMSAAPESISYTISAAGLTAELQADGSINFTADGEIIFCMPAPYLLDANYALSTDVGVTLQTLSNGEYRMIYTLDTDWLRSSERQYPVVVDPFVVTDQNINNIRDSGVSSRYPTENYQGDWVMPVGYHDTYYKSRAYIKWSNMPSLKSTNVIYKVNISCRAQNAPTDGITVSARTVTGSWASESICWNNQPSYESSVLDYVVISGSAETTYTWDITRAAKRWYSTGSDALANQGIVMTSVAENQTSSRSCRVLSSDNYVTQRPCLYIYYINANGLEDYWTYTSQNIDRAGTAYINDYTGRLTLVKDDVTVAGTSCPVVISHVYNSAQAAGNYCDTLPSANNLYQKMHAGYGWKLNIQQSVIVFNDHYLQYIDGDGTAHYFYRADTSSNTYTDEDGLGLTITANGGNYTLTDRYGNISYFYDRHLSYTQDANGNRITYVRNDYYQVTSVTRTPAGGSAETVATLSYNSYGYLSSITDMAGNKTSYTYSGNTISKVTHPDGTTVSYTYSGGKLLSAVDNESGYGVTYTYNGDGIGSFTEKAGSTTGASVSVTGGGGVRSYRWCGKDRTLNNSDDLITTMVFDYYGHTISSSTTSADGKIIYSAAASTYTSNSGTLKTNNRLLVDSGVGMRPVGNTGSYTFTNGNLLTNGDMSGSSGWTGGSYVTDSKFGRAIQVTGAAGTAKSISQTVTVNTPASQTYILSAWAKASSVALKDDSRTYTLQATLTYSDNSTETQKVNFCADSTEWQYNVLPIVPTKTYTVKSIKVEFSFNNNPNTALFTYACLTRETAASYKYNSNGDLVSVSTPDNEKQTYSYSGADLISQVTKGSGTFSYEYDSKHNVTKATNDGVSMSISYDAKGNTTGTTLTGTGTNLKITSSAAYDSTGNRITSQTDARGKTVTYTYGNNISKMTGQPTAVKNPNNVTTSSTYNSQNGRITGTAISGTASLAYAYSSGRLTTMTRSGYIPNVSGEKTQTYTMVYDSFGNMTGVKVGNKSLASYTYSSKNGQLSQMSYGNGNSVSYSYDNLERVQNVYYNGSSSPALTYTYKGEGMLGGLTDSVNNRTYSYTYDSLNRLNAMTEKAGATTVQTYNASYDTANRLTGYNYQLSPAWDGTLGSTRSYTYGYNKTDNGTDKDGSLISLTGPGGSFAYNYDDLKRLSSRVLTVNGSTLINRQLTYLAGTGTNGTTLMVSSLTNKNASGGTISEYNYTYDALGNITGISGSTSASYTYDNQGQLLSETLNGTSYYYEYDTYGNLRSKKTGQNGTKIEFKYTNADWLDLLTSYNGNAISYDAIGNPTTWYDGTTFTWVNGRRLASATNTAENLTASYTYDSDGLRLTKTINGVEHKYLWQGSKLVSEYYDGKELEFFYDESGNPYAFSYKAGSTATPITYYYLTNLQGDIVGILDSSGTTVAAYTYNAWGKLLSSSGDLADVNPLRYRGYYYDAELEMYYLKSRYYDPEICRFINADGYHSTGQGIIGNNMFAYCLNNPANYYDSNGSFAIAIPLIALGKILFDGCVSLLVIAAVWEIGCTIGEGINALRQDASISSTTINTAYASSREKVSKRVEESFSKATSLPNSSHKDELHHLVAKRATNASYAKHVLEDVGIGINSSENLMLIKYGLHRRLHTDTYYGWVNSVVISAYRSAGGDPARQAQQVRLALGTIRAFLSVLNDAAPF